MPTWRIVGVNLILISTVLYLQTCVVSGDPHVDQECKAIGQIIRSKGFSYPWWDYWQQTPADSNSHSCPAGNGVVNKKCCSGFDTHSHKSEMATTFNERWLGTKLSLFADTFKQRKTKFDVTFKSLLTRAHASFHAMFERT